MVTPEEIDSLEAGLTDWIGATNASTLLQMLGSRPLSADPTRNPLVRVSLIADLHDTLAEDDHKMADLLLHAAGYPTSLWVPSCRTAS